MFLMSSDFGVVRGVFVGYVMCGIVEIRWYSKVILVFCFCVSSIGFLVWWWVLMFGCGVGGCYG